MLGLEGVQVVLGDVARAVQTAGSLAVRGADGGDQDVRAVAEGHDLPHTALRPHDVPGLLGVEDGGDGQEVDAGAEGGPEAPQDLPGVVLPDARDIARAVQLDDMNARSAPAPQTG